MKTNFTKRALETLRPKAKRYNVLDEATRGLGVAVYPSGVKTFYHVKKVLGRPERTTIGSFPDVSVENARGKAAELNGKLARWKSNDYAGASPLERRAPSVTLEDLFKGYVERHLKVYAKSPDKAVYMAEWLFKLFDEFKTRRVDQIRRTDIAEFHSRVGNERSQYIANRALQLIRSVFNWGDPRRVVSSPKSRQWVGAVPRKTSARGFCRKKKCRSFSLPSKTNPTAI